MDIDGIKMSEKIKLVLKSRGIATLTEIQHRTLGCAANGHDIIGVSQTGTGKTLAFILPMIEQILLSKKTYHCLIVTPTRELAQQIGDCIDIFKELEIRYSLLIGGEKFGLQVGSLNERPHIIVGTPGRIALHIEKNKNFRIGLIKKLVFDEADRFFEKDFVAEIELIVKRMKSKTQTLMFTATTDEKTQIISKLFMRTPKVFEISKSYESVSKLEEYFAFVPEKYKETATFNLVKQNESKKCIIFAGMCTSAKKLEIFLAGLGIKCMCLHGNMEQKAREEAMREFRESDAACLVSTDVASRGLDIPNVDVVVNYDLPPTAKDYVHRTGRTARAGNEGRAFTFVTQYDVESFQKLEFVLGKKIQNEYKGCFDQYEQLNEAWGSACGQVNELPGFRRRR